MKPRVNIIWFRRDLRIDDNAALYHALKNKLPVVPVFIFDRNILDELEDKTDPRVEFIHQALQAMQQSLVKMGSTMDIRYGIPSEVFKNLIEEYAPEKVFTNHDYEPYAVERDNEIASLLQANRITFHSYKDQVIFERNEVMKDDGNPYTIFTPYSVKWKLKLSNFYLKSYPCAAYHLNFYKQPAKNIPSLDSMQFKATAISFPSLHWQEDVIKNYPENRDLPAIEGTSRLSVHLRFGTISIRQLAREAGVLNQTFLKELIWRDFYHMILYHFPRVVHQSFKPEYDNIPWRNNDKEFEDWCNGQTGYPIVDAGMRELNATGFMHNRVRMITASFLTKHLLVDWRWGEAYFAKKLLDYDMAANNGGWQWAAGSGCDSAPYFRIFNPYLQTKKFDPQLKYVRKWVPEYEEFTYAPPIVEHTYARARCLEVYSSALKN